MNTNVRTALISALERARGQLTDRCLRLQKAVESRTAFESVLNRAKATELETAAECEAAADIVRDLEQALQEDTKDGSKDR